MFESKESEYDYKAIDLKKLINSRAKLFKPIRHVRFKDLPPIEDDDKKPSKKYMKDAPKGIELENIADDYGVSEQADLTIKNNIELSIQPESKNKRSIYNTI